MYVQPVIGFRAWKVAHGNLHSSVQKVTWDRKKETRADCLRSFILEPQRGAFAHEGVLHPDCDCGLYGWHDLKDALREYVTNSSAVVGAAAYWGRIRVHAFGLKAEFARPLALIEERRENTRTSPLGHRQHLAPANKARPLDWERHIGHVLKRYSIPLLPLEDLKPYALTFGDQIGNSITR